MVGILTDDSLKTLAFPAKEFSDFPLDWNSKESFAFLKEMVLLSSLPDFPKTYPAESNAQNVANLYSSYIDMLYGLPGAKSDVLDALKINVIQTIRNA